MPIGILTQSKFDMVPCVSLCENALRYMTANDQNCPAKSANRIISTVTKNHQTSSVSYQNDSTDQKNRENEI